MIMQREIYLDSNATHPLLGSVKEGLAHAILNEDASLSNSSSIHRRGQKAKRAIAELKETLCQFLGRSDIDEFVLVSGATEALNLAIRGFADDRRAAGRSFRMLASSVEHSAVLDTIHSVDSNAKLFTVDQNGQLNLPEVLSTIEESVSSDCDVLLCLQLTNNETGISFDLDNVLKNVQERFGEIAQLGPDKKKKFVGRAQKVWVLLDAAQAAGKMDDSDLRRAMHFADYVALSAHKMGGPAGIGTLWVRPKSPFCIQLTGGSQERKRRAGTLNSIGALGFHLALKDWIKNGVGYRQKLTRQKSEIEKTIKKIKGLIIHGNPSLCNTLNFHVEDCPEESLLLALDLDGFCVSSGSACHSGSLKASHVLRAMGYSADEALSSIRVCLGVHNTDEEVLAFCESIQEKVEHIRRARELSEKILPAIA